ncbi:MAG: winged helix-turn-helix domain-containing protein [Firmicutes bacterium]|nr:winged helix-turn-helix domain-containing protein [Bacillota bacterium]
MILKYLRIQSDKNGSKTVNVNMSRQQLAHYLCVNRSALSHEINEMQRDGIIKMDKKRITLL